MPQPPPAPGFNVASAHGPAWPITARHCQAVNLPPIHGTVERLLGMDHLLRVLFHRSSSLTWQEFLVATDDETEAELHWAQSRPGVAKRKALGEDDPYVSDPEDWGLGQVCRFGRFTITAVACPVGPSVVNSIRRLRTVLQTNAFSGTASPTINLKSPGTLAVSDSRFGLAGERDWGGAGSGAGRNRGPRYLALAARAR